MEGAQGYDPGLVESVPAEEEGISARPGASFDPTPYLRQLRGRGGQQDYLDVKWRLLWLRKEHPDAEIVTEHVRIEPTLAIFKATVTVPTGGKATGYGSETAGDFGDFIEKAETKAIGRALNALGYGAQFGDRAGEEGEGNSPSAAGTSTSTSTGIAHSGHSGSARPAPAAPTPRTRAAAPTVAPPASDPIDIAAGRDRADARPPARPARPATAPATAALSASAPRDRTRLLAPEVDAAPVVAAGSPLPPVPPTDTVAAAADDAEPDLADYSWTAFWPWARGLGLNGRSAVEVLIGEATAGFTPAQLRERILAVRGQGDQAADA